MSEDNYRKWATPKEYRYMKALAERGFDRKKRREAMDIAGYSKNSRPVTIDRQVRPHVERFAEKHGITLDSLWAEHSRIIKEAADSEGTPRDSVRLSAIRTAHELLDNFPDKKTKLDISKKSEENITITFETIREIEAYTGERIIDVAAEEMKLLEEQKKVEDADEDDLLRPLRF